MSGTLAPTTVGAGAQASLGVNASGLTTPLIDMLVNANVEPGSHLDYQLAKEIYISHPLGGKIVDAPIRMAQSQPRELTVGTGPDEMLIEAFQAESERIAVDELVANTMRLARIYGVGSLVCGERGKRQNGVLKLEEVADADLYFSCLDPLNTAGSITLNQDPNSPDFQKPNDLAVQGVSYHRSRTVVVMNEAPIYLSWSNSTFSWGGRSVYQRALYPLKSFVQTMVTDDMISRKAGLLIAMIAQPGSIINNAMQAIAAVKRQVLKMGQTDNVLSIAKDEKIESLNMMNIDGAGTFARNNIIKNIATAVPMPARWITEDSLAEGFGEGSEDAKSEAVYVNKMRAEMQPLYDFLDPIVMRRAWSVKFYKAVQASFPEYQDVEYQTAFLDWQNSFKATWPNFLQEPDSERSKNEKVKFDAMTALLTIFMPACDPDNKARLIQWAQDNINAQALLFPVPLQLDAEAMAMYEPPLPTADGGPDDGGEPDAAAS